MLSTELLDENDCIVQGLSNKQMRTAWPGLWEREGTILVMVRLLRRNLHQDGALFRFGVWLISASAQATEECPT